jgi:uncharacterized protein
MSTTNKSIIFLAFAFAITWAIVISAWTAGLHEGPNAAYILAASMFGPSVAALICALAFEKGRRVAALGLKFKPNWWWALAWLIPVLISGAAVAFTVLLSPHNFVDPATGVIAMAEAHSPEAAEQARGVPYLGVLVMVQALVIGALINAVILTISEELGWRGYLYDLWRGAGFWRYSLALLFGHNYPDDRLLGVGLFTVFCVLLSPILTLVRDRGQSTWAAGIFHGTFNALGGMTIVMVGMAPFPWNGIVGIGGFVALALGLLVVIALQRGGARTETASAQA